MIITGSIKILFEYMFIYIYKNAYIDGQIDKCLECEKEFVLC